MVLLAALTVTVDPRFELLYAVFRAAGADEYVGQVPRSPYTDALDARIAGHEADPAIVGLRDLRATTGVGFDAPGRLAVWLDDRYEPKIPLRRRPPGLDPRWRPPRTVDRWLRDVRRFAAEIGFAEFFASQQPLREDAERAFRDGLASDDVSGWFEAFFGTAPDLRVHPSPLTGPNNYGASYEGPKGKEIHAVIGLYRQDDHAVFGPTQRDLLVHEAAHGVAEPIVAAHPDLVVAAGKAAILMEKTLHDHHYGGGDTVANETLTRGITLAFLHDRHPDAVARQLASDEGQGFPWIEAAYQGVLASRTGAHLDPDRAAAAARDAITAWVALPEGERSPPFRGTINAASTRATSLVVPASGPAADYGAQIYRQFYEKRGAKLVRGEVPGGSATVYGTPADPLVAQILASAGADVQPGSVSIAGRRFEGEHLALIVCRPVPGDPRAAWLAYTAATEADLAGINGVFHGPTDWVVARLEGGRWRPVGSGDFPKDASWR